jgi:hypothetical protein
MFIKWNRYLPYLPALLMLSSVCPSQEKPPAKLVLKADKIVGGPYGGQQSSSCLQVFSDGKVLYARWWVSAFTTVDKDTGEKSRPEQTRSVEYHLEDSDNWQLSSFLKSGAVKELPEKFDPPQMPVDYFELVTVRITEPSGKNKQISIREFGVASLEQKSRYPSALVVLMGEIKEIEKAATEKGKSVGIPSGCQLNPK